MVDDADEVGESGEKTAPPAQGAMIGEIGGTRSEGMMLRRKMSV